MLLSTILVSILSLGVISNVDLDEDFLKEEIIEAREECSTTFLTRKGTYISFYYGEPIFERNDNNELVPIEEKEEQTRTTGSYTGSTYISNKYFEVGYSTTYTSSLFLGKSSIQDPYGNTPEYQTVYGLTLPIFDTAHYTIRDAGFVLKRKSGSLSSALAYKVNSPTYPNINGTATISKSLIGLVTLSSSYSTLDISDEVNAVISSSSTTSLNILLAGTANNGTCYLYRATDGISNRPYFYIEYDNYGIAPAYWETFSENFNCFAYALGRDYMSTGLTNFASNLDDALGQTLIDINSLANIALPLIRYQFSNNAVQISTYDSVISSNQRRVAFRVSVNNSGKYDDDYHFVIQCADGGWACKYGTSPSTYYPGESSVYTNEATIWNMHGYNSVTLYFATTCVYEH